MENMNLISQFIGAVGFPIFATIAIWYQMNQQSKLHKEEMDKFNEALLNNTRAITELSTLIKGGHSNVE